MKKTIKKIYNSPLHPNMIYNFQLKNGIMKTKYIDSFDLQDKDKLQETKTTEGVSLKVFEKFVEEMVTELKLIGPWEAHSLVAKCAPRMEW